jgi:hypothetical protein
MRMRRGRLLSPTSMRTDWSCGVTRSRDDSYVAGHLVVTVDDGDVNARGECPILGLRTRTYRAPGDPSFRASTWQLSGEPAHCGSGVFDCFLDAVETQR